jgi:pentatricopeptide repeat protein
MFCTHAIPTAISDISVQGIQAEVRTYNTVISACNKGGQAEHALQIYERMLSAGVKPSATTYTALIRWVSSATTYTALIR